MKNESVTECFIGKIFNFQPNNIIINMLNASHIFEKETKLYFNYFDNYLHSNAAWTSTVIHDCFLC